MSKENAATSETKEAKSGLRIAQVMAAALAAVTAALLGSTLGVAGTVAGAGVASVITTVGGEVYLRSLQRTRAAASKARQLATSGIRRRGGAEVPLAEQPTVRLKRPDDLPTDGPDDEPGRLRKLRWPLIIGTSVVAFAVAILAMVSVDAATGGKVAGGTGAGIGKIFGSGSGPSTPTPSTTPSTSTNDTQDSPTDTSSTTTQSNTPPTTSSDTPTTTPTTPSTTSQKPTTSAAPPTSQGAASTPTP